MTPAVAGMAAQATATDSTFIRMGEVYTCETELKLAETELGITHCLILGRISGYMAE
jgi:hypothetical protein